MVAWQSVVVIPLHVFTPTNSARCTKFVCMSSTHRDLFMNVDSDALAHLIGMGFEADAARLALTSAENNIETALGFLLGDSDDRYAVSCPI